METDNDGMVIGSARASVMTILTAYTVKPNMDISRILEGDSLGVWGWWSPVGSRGNFR